MHIDSRQRSRTGPAPFARGKSGLATVRCLVAGVVALSLLGCAAGDRQSTALDPEHEALARQGSILELQTAMESGGLTARGLSEYFLARIELRSDLNAIISLSANALDAADALDAERASGAVRGPLHGIPILVKDNIETKDLPTTAGSLALAENHTGRDATVVARLREAGAVILGKTNLSEWANFRSQRSSSGWSAVGGQTRNPHDTSRSPCGSSSGSGVAVAAGLAVAALGTETSGSVVCPASVNGVVGVKPTVGLVSRFGIVPISHNQDTAGPMTRNVADAALLLTVMAGLDTKDEATRAAPQRFGQDYAGALTADGLQGARVGIVRSATGYHEGVDALFEQAIADLERGGAVIVDGLRFEGYPAFSRDSLDVLLYEFKRGLNAYLAALPNELNSLTLEALIRFNEDHADQEMPYFRQELFEQAQAKGPLTESDYVEALARIRQETRTDGIDRLLEDNDLAVLIAPTLGPAWTIDLVTGDRFLGGFAGYPARAAYPHVTVPMGKVHGLPVGLSFTGPRFGEADVLSAAFAYEQAIVDRQTDPGTQ